MSLSSSSIVFIALQCCQCSTMQVKQKKKSSNKWSCAVCNEKQSVRKVFAQGYLASDIRKFVQTFNMSRKSLDENAEWTLIETLAPSQPEHDFEKKKRTDWAAYLDQDDDCITIKGGQQQQEADDFEPLVVTELPKSMSKKRRSVENSTAGGDRHFQRTLFPNSQGDDYEPLVVTESPKSMSKNHRSVENSTAGGDRLRPLFSKFQEELMKDKKRIALLTESNSERNNKVTPYTQRAQKCKPTISKTTSKWNDYLAEDKDNLGFEWKGSFTFKDHLGLCNTNNNVLEAMTSEQRVEDDIHPDFM